MPASHDPNITFAAPAGERQCDVAGPAHAAVGPDVLAEPSRLAGALDDGGELGSADAGHHPRRAHRAWSDAHLDDVGTGLDQLARALGGDDVAGDDRRVGDGRTYLLDDLEDGGLVAVRGVDHEDVDAHRGKRRGAPDRIGVDPDGHRDQQPAIGVDGRAVDRRAQTRPST